VRAASGKQKVKKIIKLREVRDLLLAVIKKRFGYANQGKSGQNEANKCTGADQTCTLAAIYKLLIPAEWCGNSRVGAGFLV